jgi:sortase A
VIPTTDVTKATLTLVSCTPRYSATNRIVVHADLVPDQSDALTEAAPVVPGVVPDDPASVTLPDEGSGTAVGTVDPTTDTASVNSTAGSVASTTETTDSAATDTTAVPTDAAAATPDAFSDGWFSDSSAIVPAILWGLLLAAIGYGVYWLSHKVRRYWVGVLAGFIPFLVVLYFFYENVNRLLPPNL